MAVTLKDIARRLNLSVTTVSRGLAGYDDVAAVTQQRIQETATEMGYYPNITARRLQKQRTDTLGFIMPTYGPRFSDPFFSEFIAGIGNEAAVHDYDLLVSALAPESEEEHRAYLKAVRRGWVDGLIVVRTRVNDTRVQLLCQHNFPFVAFGRTNDNLTFPFVDEDSEMGMRLLVQHFIDLGHRSIAYIRPPSDLMFSLYRMKGFTEAMQKNGLSIRPEWVVEGDMTQRGGAEKVDQLLALTPPPTAILGGNDLMAFGVINRLQQLGINVGQEIAVAGFDDIPLAEHFHPSLTTIHQPIYEIGRRTCATLLDVINGRVPQNSDVLLTPTLVVRASSSSLTI
ncbi:MAG: LacI family transcriptional regulator [Chloroflexi bacterium]|nr:LacI family transcriptional regulator [Chloroflexota bacterium]